MVEGGTVFKIISGKSTGNRPIQISRRIWEGIIRIDFKEIGSIQGIRLILLRIGIIGEPLEMNLHAP